MTRMDSTRITKNFGYMARTLKDRAESEYEDAGKACLEHQFDNHIYCGSWCKRKDETEQQRKTSVKYYPNMENDGKLYQVLKEKTERFLCQDRLAESAHTLYTNMNEAFNQVCTWFAPKNKVFAGTGSLHNRIAFAVSINSLGVEFFFKQLFKALGLPLTDNVAYYLALREKNRNKRLIKVKTKEVKKVKNKQKIDKLGEDTKIAKMELRKRLGTYRRGMNLEGPVEDDVVAVAGAAEQPPKKAKGSNYCAYCGKAGHLTRRSKDCTAKQSTVKRFRKADGLLLSAAPSIGLSVEPAALTAEALLAQEDCDAIDLMPLTVRL
jgi:hypothetical protein